MTESPHYAAARILHFSHDRRYAQATRDELYRHGITLLRLANRLDMEHQCQAAGEGAANE